MLWLLAFYRCHQGYAVHGSFVRPAGLTVAGTTTDHRNNSRLNECGSFRNIEKQVQAMKIGSKYERNVSPTSRNAASHQCF